MPINRCDPCCLIGGNMSSPVFYQNALQVLCNISAGIVPGGGELTPSAPTNATIATSTTVALAANANRKGVILVNTSANLISLAFGAPAVLGSGASLEPNGGTFNMDPYCFSTLAVNAIASGAGSNLSIQEYT